MESRGSRSGVGKARLQPPPRNQLSKSGTGTERPNQSEGIGSCKAVALSLEIGSPSRNFLAPRSQRRAYKVTRRRSGSCRVVATWGMKSISAASTVGFEELQSVIGARMGDTAGDDGQGPCKKAAGHYRTAIWPKDASAFPKAVSNAYSLKANNFLWETLSTTAWRPVGLRQQLPVF